MKFYGYILPIFISINACSSDLNILDNLTQESIAKCGINKNSSIENIEKLLNCGEFESAFKIIDLKEEKLTSNERMDLAYSLFNRGFYKKSAELLKVESDKGVAEAQYRLGYIYVHVDSLKNINKALFLFNEAVNNGYYDAYVNLGEIYLFEKEYLNFELAEKNYNFALFHNVNIAYCGLGEFFLQKHIFDKALKSFDNCFNYGYSDLAYNGYYNLYYSYPDYTKHSVEKSKSFLDLLLLHNKNSHTYNLASDFYKGNHQFKDLKKSHYYLELAKDYEDTVANSD